MSRLDSDEIREHVEAVLKARFPKVRVLSINIPDEDEDEDGDGEVRVKIIFEAAAGDFNPKLMPVFLSAVIDRLNEAEESRFPIISFISKSDLGNRKPETV